MSYDVIAELGFGDSFGCIKTGSDVGGFAQAFERDAPFFGLMGCLYPFTTWIKKTWFGKRYLVAKAEDKSGWGTFMALRDRLIDRRKADIEGGTYNGRVDLLQTFVIQGIFSLAKILLITEISIGFSIAERRKGNLLIPNTSRPRLLQL